METAQILMVDDSATVVTLTKMMLKQEGYELLTASNGKEALLAVRRRAPALVLMDVVMPEMGGVECCKALKSDAQTKHIPVIMVTTKGDQTMVSAAYAAGCDDFITKPIDKVELLQKIKGHLGVKGGR